MQIVASSSPYGFSPIGGGGVGARMNNNNMASLASPPRGRVSPVRRRLFFSEEDGDDHQQEQMDNRTSIIQQQLEAMQLDQQRRWNFDFANQEPLDGRYRWFASTAAIERPSHPLPPPVAIKRPRNQQQQQVVVTKMARLDWCNNNNNSSRLPLSSTCQTKITDFMQNRKTSELNLTKHRDEQQQKEGGPLVQ